MERLQKVIATSGIASRRKAEDLISNGCVSVNGKIVTELGTKVSSSDIIVVNGKQITKENYGVQIEKWEGKKKKNHWKNLILTRKNSESR